jgi:amyloid beta precursor protein binding protein 1
MESSTAAFIALQEIYQSKALVDRTAFAAHLGDILGENGKPRDAISPNDILLFCRNVFSLECLSTRTIEEEYSSPNVDEMNGIAYDWSDPEDQTPILWYIALRAADRFQLKNGRFPGENDDDSTLEADASLVGQEITALVAEMGLQGYDGIMDPVKHSAEMTRYGAAELHNIASLVGGVASQETVKIITHQYTPQNNTFVFNGIAGIGAHYEL